MSLKNLIKGFSFHLIWLDIIPDSKSYGFGLLTVQKYRNNDEWSRSLFSIYYYESLIDLTIFYIPLISWDELTLFDHIQILFKKRGWIK